MKLKLTSAQIEWLDRKNISFHNRFSERLRPGDEVEFLDALEVEPYIGIHAGFTICSMGYMSYSNSPLPASLVVGRYCSLAHGITFPSYRHPVEHLSTSIFTHDKITDLVIRALRGKSSGHYNNFYPNPQKGPPNIEHDVWVGQNAAIMAGVSLGIGSVVAANSVVTRSVGPYEIVGGNPAALIRKRFSDATISKLLASEWWLYDFIDFRDLNISDVNIFIESFAQLKPAIRRYCPEKIRLSQLRCVK